MCATYRKVEGEAKGEGHGAGAAVVGGVKVPLRRWEDWERSRLRKLRREERRRKELERLNGTYMGANGEYLGARNEVFSQYDGSDTVSVASSDEDQWGAQIGAYNENSTQYPPPPISLMPANAFASAETVAGSDLEAMLDVGFDDRPSTNNSRAPTNAARYQLSDSNGYTPLSRGSPLDAPSRNPTLSPITPITPLNEPMSAASNHSTRSDGQGYGPLGPLDPDTRG